jgi:hypothetical protein
MAAVGDVDELIEQWQLAAGEFVKGNPEPVKRLWSRREDVTLANPYSPPVRGWEQVAKTIEHAASLHRDGEFVGSEIVAKYVTPELAYVVPRRDALGLGDQRLVAGSTRRRVRAMANGIWPLPQKARRRPLAADSGSTPALAMMLLTHSRDRSGTVGLRRL